MICPCSSYSVAWGLSHLLRFFLLNHLQPTNLSTWSPFRGWTWIADTCNGFATWNAGININYHVISYHIISYHISYYIIYHIYHIIYIISYISYISYHIIYHIYIIYIISYHISYIPYHISYIISYHISYNIIYIISYIISYHITHKAGCNHSIASYSHHVVSQTVSAKARSLYLAINQDIYVCKRADSFPDMGPLSISYHESVWTEIPCYRTFWLTAHPRHTTPNCSEKKGGAIISGLKQLHLRLSIIIHQLGALKVNWRYWINFNSCSVVLHYRNQCQDWRWCCSRHTSRSFRHVAISGK
jgi:hypothetical protein